MEYSGKKHESEEVVAKLCQVDVLLSRGRSAGETVRSIGVTQFTCCRWRKEFSRLKDDQAKRLKELEKENDCLCKAVSDLTLGKLILKEAASENIRAPLPALPRPCDGEVVHLGAVCRQGSRSALFDLAQESHRCCDRRAANLFVPVNNLSVFANWLHIPNLVLDKSKCE